MSGPSGGVGPVVVVLDGSDPGRALRAPTTAGDSSSGGHNDSNNDRHDDSGDDRPVVFIERAADLDAVTPQALLDAARGRVGAASVAGVVIGMTDALKRVEGAFVVASVDRATLQVVNLPLVVPAALARRWAESSAGGPRTAAALLSELASIEPNLRVVDLDPDRTPGASHG